MNKTSIGLGKLYAVFKASTPAESFEQMEREGWATIEEQKAYWKNRDSNLDRIEATTKWFDEQRSPFD